ncbi:MAG: hypothetical protein HN595_04510 [Flavobacteriaceae bacterium]|nr:hypothetical protein [Flavobacteriaceae bacterium]
MRFFILLSIILSSIGLYSQEHEYSIKAEFDIVNKKIKIKQNLLFFNKYDVELNYLILNDWANSYSNSKSNLGNRLSEEYALAFQRSTKSQRGSTVIKKIYKNNYNFDFSRPINNIDLIKINLVKPLKKGDSISFDINYEIIIPDDNFTGYGIDKSGEINIRDWYLTFSKIKHNEWIKESNLDLNDLSHDPAYFDFNITFPKEYDLISDINQLKLNKKLNLKNFISVKEIRKNSSLILTKKSNYVEYITNDIKIYSDIDNYENKSDEIVNKVISYVDDKTGNKIPLSKINNKIIQKDSLIIKILNYAEKKIGNYPYNKMVVSRKNQSRRPIYGINNLPKIISPFDQSFLFEFNFLKEFLHTYLEESILLHKRKKYWEIEGIVIYLLMDYIDTYYPELKLIGKYSNLKILKNRNYAKYSFNEQYRLFENIISSRNINQPLGLSLDSLTRINQKIINPYKTGLGIKMLSQTLNKEIIDNSIKEFFEKNNLKNNTPISFQEIIERNSRNNSSWFFNDFLKRKSFKDFTIKKINESNKLTYFKLSNYYNSNSPIQLSLLKDNKILKEDWIILKGKDTIISYESNLYDFIEINKNKYITERNYKNNLASFKNYKKPFKLILFNDFESTYNKQLNYIPLLGYNLYDGLMPGITLTNITLIKKPFSYKIKPFYSSKQKKILGSMNLKYTKYNENKKLFSTQYFISGSTFHYKENLSYTSLFPSITLTFRNSDLRSNFRQFLNFRYISIYREENIDQQKYPNYNIFNTKYILTNSNGGKGFTLNSDLQISKSFVKTSFTGMYRNYYKDNRQYNFRLFIGKFLYNSTDDDYFSFSTYRARDYMFNYNLLGRSETTGFYSQQFISSEGALKSMINPAYSNDWLISVNSGITLWQWIEGYYDLAFIKNKNKNIQTAYDSGIRLNILTDYFELYFPFYSSLGNELKHSNYSDKIRFKITFDPNTVSGLFTRRWF